LVGGSFLKSLLEEGARSHFEGKREVFIAIYIDKI
jgi:hypothetical protein